LLGELVADPQLDVLVVCGSLRRGSYNAALARMLPALAPPGLALRPASSFEKFPIYNLDLQNSSGFPAEVNAWADAIRAADALIIVSPEYNWSIPGGLKNAIDWASRMKEQPFRDKPVALQSAAPGILGGSRSQYHLRQSLSSVELPMRRKNSTRRRSHSGIRRRSINNAALFAPLQETKCTEIDAELWDRVMAINLRGPFLMVKHVVPHMIAAGYGKIINIGSGTAFRGIPWMRLRASSASMAYASTRWRLALP